MKIKRNNPGNIRKDARWNWVGEPVNTPVGTFIEFDKLENGYRAMLKDLNNKIKAGTDTISKIIYKYAPPSDNNPTENYIRFVSNSAGIPATEKLNAGDGKKVSDIAYSMSLFEHGVTDDGTMKAAIDKARKLLFGITETATENPVKTVTVIAVTGILLYLLFFD